jgi:hypothetical protein
MRGQREPRTKGVRRRSYVRGSRNRARHRRNRVKRFSAVANVRIDTETAGAGFRTLGDDEPLLEPTAVAA